MSWVGRLQYGIIYTLPVDISNAAHTNADWNEYKISANKMLNTSS